MCLLVPAADHCCKVSNDQAQIIFLNYHQMFGVARCIYTPYKVCFLTYRLETPEFLFFYSMWQAFNCWKNIVFQFKGYWSCSLSLLPVTAITRLFYYEKFLTVTVFILYAYLVLPTYWPMPCTHNRGTFRTIIKLGNCVNSIVCWLLSIKLLQSRWW